MWKKSKKGKINKKGKKKVVNTLLKILREVKIASLYFLILFKISTLTKNVLKSFDTIKKNDNICVSHKKMAH